MLLFSACEEERDVSTETIYEVENHSTKDIAYEVKTDIGSDVLYLKPQDTKKMSFRKEEKQVVETYPMGEHLFDLVKLVQCDEQVLYSISDTSKYVRISSLAASQYDSLFDANQRSWFEGDVFNRVERVAFQITDSLLAITEKDYAMLDKFKEYYANE
jgi:hypothetical protein